MAEMVATTEPIKFYRASGQWGFLSNLYKAQMRFGLRSFSCAEAAYQFGKPVDVAVAEWIVDAPKPHLIAMAAHGLFVFDVKPEWNNVKVDRMRLVLAGKFRQHPDLAALLKNTGHRELIEASSTDAFWGVGKKGNGKNMLGVLLMELRSTLNGGTPNE